MDQLEIDRIAKIMDEDIEHGAARHKLDKETFQLLKTFQQEFFIFVNDPDTYIDHLKRYEHRIKQMGSALQSLGFARPVKGAEFAWLPRNKLREIINLRAGFPPDPDVTIDKLNEAIIKSCLEVADVADCIVSFLWVIGLEGVFENSSKRTRRVRDILSSATIIKRGSERVLFMDGSSVRTAKYLGLGCPL